MPTRPAAAANDPAAKMAALSSSFASHIEPEKEADGTVGLWAFFFIALEWIKKLAADKLDTEEERDLIVDVIMVAADRIVAPRVWGWVMIRPMVRDGLDVGIDYLPALLA